MFCKNCGNEISANEKFCGVCGTPVEQKQTVNASNSNLSLNKSVLTTTATPLFIATAVLHLFQIVFWLTNALSVSAMGFSQSASINSFLDANDMGVINFMTIIFSIAAIVLCLLSVFTNGAAKKCRMPVSILASLWTLAWFLICYSIAADDVASSYVSLSPTFGGSMLVLLPIACVILNICISNKAKKQKQTPNQI